MGFGLGVLRLAPRDFWAMTPRELRAAVQGPVPPAAVLNRNGLDALIRRFPDAPPAKQGDRDR
jgi:uncharacterized phage protein (TIGR02216 family)